MWRFFRESGPRRDNIPEDLYTMEIHHGGYFDKMPDGTKKYRVARFNKDGGKIWLDGLDPDKIAWTEFGNIAWDLGYREKPISYYFKIPRTSCNEGWMPIKNDADAIEMIKLIPLKTRQISVYITGGGKRRKKEAEEDDLRPSDPDWENPLNRLTVAERVRLEQKSNIFASQLNRTSGVGGVNVGGGVGADVNAGGQRVRHMGGNLEVIKLDSDSDKEVGNGVQQQSQGTFTGLSDLVPDLFASQGEGIQSELRQGQNSNRGYVDGCTGVFSGFYNAFIPHPREKHCVTRLKGRPEDKAAESTKEGGPVQGAVEAEGTVKNAAAATPPKEQLDPIQEEVVPIVQEAEVTEPKVEEAAVPSVEEEVEPRVEEKAVPIVEEAEPRVEEEAGVKESEPTEQAACSKKGPRGEDSNKGKKKRFSEAEKGKKVAPDTQAKGKKGKLAAKNKKGRQTKEPRYRTRYNGAKVYEQVDESRSSSDGSDFYVDSDYDQDDEEDDAQFEEHVSNPQNVEEFEDMIGATFPLNSNPSPSSSCLTARLRLLNAIMADVATQSCARCSKPANLHYNLDATESEILDYEIS
ncbi:uncharacterized protein LOC133732511 [Rosa rugosa]|uniref:uncharacterized protein LOC133732511 n=1 Tax=Rosa rugosa TaxID=74645 RepID=UPI002B40071C|nr:uncharacterized protein LOC133732511 [Rosa rugosa]